jgi:hypothetical protein
LFQNVTTIGVEKHDALRQDLDRFAQPLVRFPSVRNRSLRLSALAHDFPDFRRHAPAAAGESRTGLRGPAGNAGDRRMLLLF